MVGINSTGPSRWWGLVQLKNAGSGPHLNRCAARRGGGEGSGAARCGGTRRGRAGRFAEQVVGEVACAAAVPLQDSRERD